MDAYDLLGKCYGDSDRYTVEKYCGVNSSGYHTYEIKFKETGNTCIRVRSSIMKGQLKDTKQKKTQTKQKAIQERKKLNENKDAMDFVHGDFDISKPTLVLDQATLSSGYCVIENGNIVSEMGFIKQDRQDTLSIRIFLMKKEVKTLIQKHNIKNIVLEDIFLGSNLKTYRALCCLIGVLIELAVELDISISLVTASVWREYYNISGVRTSCKTKALYLVESKFGLKLDKKQDDLAEVLLIAHYIISSCNKTAEYDWS